MPEVELTSPKYFRELRMFITFSNFETNNYSAELFKVQNEALATATFVSADHPHFDLYSSDFEGVHFTLLRFHALELYLAAHPAYQAALEKFVSDKEYLNKPWKKRLRSSQINPILEIIPVLKEYSIKKNLPLDKQLTSERVAYNENEDLLDDTLFTSNGKIHFILKVLEHKRYGHIKESVEKFWDLRRYLQKVAYLDDKDPVKKIIIDYFTCNYEKDVYYPNGYPDSRNIAQNFDLQVRSFIEALEMLSDEKAIARELDDIKKCKSDSGYGQRYLMVFDEARGWRGLETNHLMFMNIYLKEITFDITTICRDGTASRMDAFIKMANKYGYKKSSILDENDVKEVIALIQENIEKSHALLQGTYDARMREFDKIEQEEKAGEEKALVKKEDNFTLKSIEPKNWVLKYFEFSHYPTEKEINSQYRKLVLDYHPDLIGGDGKDFVALNEEREKLLSKIAAKVSIPQHESIKLLEYVGDISEAKELTANQMLAEVLKNTKFLSDMAFQDRVEKTLHEECIKDKATINPIPVLIKMLEAIDLAFIQVQASSSKLDRKRISLLQEVYTRHVSEIFLCAKGKVDHKPFRKLAYSDIAFVQKSALLTSEDPSLSLFASSNSSLIKAQNLIRESGLDSKKLHAEVKALPQLIHFV